MNIYQYLFATVALVYLLLIPACKQNTQPDDDFFERQNVAHDGDYLATYPLSNADSCIARLKAEVPEHLQPWGCLSIWYHMPRTNPAVNFRLLELYEENYPHDTVSAFAQLMRGEFYVSLAEFDSARICLEDAHEIYTALDRPLDASDATYLQARSYLYQYRFADALQSYFEVLDLLDKYEPTFTHRRASLYHDIAIAYERNDDRLQELSWLNKLWEVDFSNLDNSWRYRAMAANGLSIHYLKTDPDSSLYWANMTIDIFKKENKAALPPASFVYWQARAYFKKGECSTALPYFLDAYRRNRNKQEVFDYYRYPMALGECYLCLGKLDSAEVYLNEALPTPDTLHLSVTHKLLSEVYEKRGDWQKALTEARESRRLYETKFTTDKVKEVAALEARYENAKKEHRIARLEEQKKSTLQQGFLIVLSLLLTLGLLLSLFFRQRGRRRILEQENELLEQGKKLAEAEAQLKNQELKRTTSDLRASKDNLQTTQKELDSTNHLLLLKTQLIEELQMKLIQKDNALDKGDLSARPESDDVYSMKILTKEDWSRFRKKFEQSFPGYLHELKRMFPEMTVAELRLFLLLKLDFENWEIAETLGISPKSVIRTRHRLRRKLGFENNKELDHFILHFK